MVTIEANSLDALAAEAIRNCKERAVNNLILHGIFPYEEVNSRFIKMNDEIASKWQSPKKPDDLFINHGEYVNKFGDGREFLVEELRRKKDSNRACLSLMNMEDIIGSGDNPIPSFLTLQFGFPESGMDKLAVTAYFRALEVSEFLLINLAEISQYIRLLKSRFPSIEWFELMIIAFRAHYIPQFHCLRKAEIDSADPVDIAIAVERLELKKVREWIDSKMTISESIICTDGLEVLYRALEKCKSKYDAGLISDIREVLADMNQLKETREASSHSEVINILNLKIRRKLSNARERIR